MKKAGYTVSVVCPKGGAYRQPYEELDGIHIFRHPMLFEADGAVGYLFEYLWALAWELALSIRAYFKVGSDVVQACNPPDLIFIVGGFWKYLFGKAFIFDHHDINPELYEAKFGRRDGFYRLLKLFECWIFKTADASIATNETFKKIAIRRGGMAADDVFVVRSIPDLSRFKRVAENEKLRNGRRHVVGYVGIMGAQDGVDLLIDAMHYIVHGQGRDDVQAVIVGSGTELAGLKHQARRLGLCDHVTFTGFQSGASLMSALSTFDVGVIPDPKNTYNDKISMNKAFEYMGPLLSIFMRSARTSITGNNKTNRAEDDVFCALDHRGPVAERLVLYVEEADGTDIGDSVALVVLDDVRGKVRDYVNADRQLLELGRDV